MNLWHDITFGKPEEFHAVIEIPKLSRIKYELEKESGQIIVDRVLYSPMHYPANYGFAPQTLWDDGDPLDVLILSHEPFVPGCLIGVRPIGVLEMEDDGESDAKVLAVPTQDPRYKGIDDIKKIEPHTLEEIKHFFKVYKDLQKKNVIVGEWRGKSQALKDIKHSLKLYKEKYPT